MNALGLIRGWVASRLYWTVVPYMVVDLYCESRQLRTRITIDYGTSKAHANTR